MASLSPAANTIPKITHPITTAAGYDALRSRLDRGQTVKVFRGKKGVVALGALQSFIAQIDDQMSERAFHLDALFLGQLFLFRELEPAHRAIDHPRIPEVFYKASSRSFLAIEAGVLS